MSDDDSFVILGTSPTPSMVSLQPEELSPQKANKTELIKEKTIVESQMTNSSNSMFSQLSVSSTRIGSPIVSVNGENNSMKALLADGMENTSTPTPQPSVSTSTPEPFISTSNEDADALADNSNQKLNAENSEELGSLAASFILGEVDPDVLKNSIYTQFPSLCSMNDSSDEALKLQTLMSEYLELKKTVISTNNTMKQLYYHMRKAKETEEERKMAIAKLRNENLELRRDLESKIEQLQVNEDIRRKEQEEFIKHLSEKASQINNMSLLIDKLQECQNSFEFIPAKENKDNEKDEGHITLKQHQQLIAELQKQISDLIETQRKNVEEINSLKTQLASVEAELKKAQSDVNFLKSNGDDKNELFNSMEKEHNSLKIEVDLLRQQLDIYSRDFKMEQDAKENLANEKGQLLRDLRLLQKKNQELIQEATKNYEKQSTKPTGAFPKDRSYQPIPSPPEDPFSSAYRPKSFICPLCGASFGTFDTCLVHVNHCLDGSI